MKLGLNMGYWGAGNDADNLALAKEADRLGYDVAWVAEAYGSDAPTLDTLSGGRFRLGLGVSGPQVSEGWHGVRFDKPLARTREYVDIVNMALSRQKVKYAGDHYVLPLPDGPGKALQLTVHPVRDHIPTYLAAVGPKNLELSGEKFDGWLAIFYSAEFAKDQLASIAAGREKAGKTMDGFDVVPTVPIVVGDDARACADPIRWYAALYVGGMGSREKNFYNQLASRMGFEEQAKQIQDLYLDRKYDEAAAAVPYEFIEQTALLGSKERIADKMTQLSESGVTTLTLSPFAGPLEERKAVLRTALEALELSGVGG
ncbi:MAG: LLM class flavin-dependent oxidoreductase [Actinobacteria bacterium]|nr:LLM class flavin-dependent oxidoreductase [Actinomycetota bacterium]